LDFFKDPATESKSDDAANVGVVNSSMDDGWLYLRIDPQMRDEREEEIDITESADVILAMLRLAFISCAAMSLRM
jgi:RNA binding exosome subunit